MSRRYYKRRECKLCGETKHLICLEHNTFVKRKNNYLRPFRRIRYYFRKFYFGVARKLGFVD